MEGKSEEQDGPVRSRLVVGELASEGSSSGDDDHSLVVVDVDQGDASAGPRVPVDPCPTLGEKKATGQAQDNSGTMGADGGAKQARAPRPLPRRVSRRNSVDPWADRCHGDPLPKFDYCIVFPLDRSAESAFDEVDEEGEPVHDFEKSATRALKQLQPDQQGAPNDRNCLSEAVSVFTDHLDTVVLPHPKVVATVRKRALDRMERVGLVFESFVSRDDDEVFVRIACPDDLLFRVAESAEYHMQLKDELEGGWVPYSSAHHAKFKCLSTRSWTWFGERDRHHLTQLVLGSTQARGGCELRLRALQHSGVIKEHFPLHVPEDRQQLLQHWTFAPFRRQPIEQIKEYLGQRIALYFVWLGHYTAWLLVPGVLGVVFTVLNILHGFGTTTAWWCALMCVWSTFYLESWKRVQSTYSYRWGTHEFELHEEERPEYIGHLVKDYRGRLTRVYPSWKRTLKIAIGVPVITCFLGTAIAAMTGVMIYRALARQHTEYGILSAISAGVMNALVIGVLNFVYGKMAKKLTMWENYRTHTEEEDNLIFKTFMFQFINSYSSLFYIAFFKESGWVEGDQCRSFINPEERNCVEELSVQLGSIFVTQFTVGNIVELGVPLLKARWKVHKEESTARSMRQLNSNNNGDEEESELGDMTTEEEQSKLEDYGGTFEDYNEMAVQFGYVTLFSAAFPLVVTLALLNNFVEIRSDSYKLLTCYKRPLPYPAQTIGTWYRILEIMGFIAVTTNCGFFFLALPPPSSVGDDAYSQYWSRQFHAFFWAEHLLLVVKLVLAAMIPDVPADVKAEWDRRNYFARKHCAKELLEDEDEGEDEEEVAPGGLVKRRSLAAPLRRARSSD